LLRGDVWDEGKLPEKRNFHVWSGFGGAWRVADIFNCCLGSFPMKYLGTPISNRKILASEFDFLPMKVQKRLGTWLPMSPGGRKILIDACLDNI
jgi:hypothetical protein